jgi:hypothetical protein
MLGSFGVMMQIANVNIDIIDAYDFVRYTTSNTGCWALEERDGGLPQIRIHLSKEFGSVDGLHNLFQMIITEMRWNGYDHCGFINHSAYS